MKAIATGAAHTAAAFISPSGNGVKVLVAVEPNPTDAVSHTAAWRTAAAYYDELLSGAADSSGKDLPRLTLLAHDPSACLAEEITPLRWEVSLHSTQSGPQPSRNGVPIIPPYKERTNGKNSPADDAALTDALRYVPPDDYETWLLVGMAIHHDGGDVSLWEEWSRCAPSKYEAGACERKWRTFTAGGGITLGTVYDLAKQNGWKGHPKAPRKQKDKNSTEPKSTDLPYSDAYNADLFARQHGEDFRWVDDNNHWLYWTGKRWVVDRHNIIYEKMKATILGLSANAEAMTDNDAVSKLFKHITSSLSQVKIKAAIESAHSLLAAVPEDFDTKGHLFNCANGTIDLQDGSSENIGERIYKPDIRGLSGKGLTTGTRSGIGSWSRFNRSRRCGSFCRGRQGIRLRIRCAKSVCCICTATGQTASLRLSSRYGGRWATTAKRQWRAPSSVRRDSTKIQPRCSTPSQT